MRGSTKIFISLVYGPLIYALYGAWDRSSVSEFMDILIFLGIIGIGVDIVTVACMECSDRAPNDPWEPSCSHQPWIRKANPMFWVLRGFWRYCGFLATYIPKLWRFIISFLDKTFD